MGKFSRLFLAIAFVLMLLPQTLPAQAEKPASNNQVLIIHSYHSGLNWTDSIMNGIRDTFAHSGLDIQMSAEYLDARRFPDSEYTSNIRELLISKLKGTTPDLVMVSDNAAFEFVLEQRKRLFPDTPVVFCGVNDFHPSMISKYRGITGVAEDVSIIETVELALRLHPKTREIIVIGRTTASDKYSRDAFVASLPGLPPQITVTFWDDLSVKEVRERLKELGEGSILFINGLITDETGRLLIYGETTRLISRESPVPAFILWDVFVGYGTLGGKVVSGYTQGQMAGELALRILKGESADQIAVINGSNANRYMFDYRQLKKFHIPMSNLPKDAIIINRPDSLYERYKMFVWVAAAIAILLSSFVILLGTTIIRRRKAERELMKSEKRMRLFFERQLVGMAITSPEKGWLQVNDKLCEMLDYSRSELTRLTWAEMTYPDDLALDIAQFDQLLAGEINDYSMEKRFIRKDETVIFTNLSVGCVRRDDGTVDYVLALLEDITERKQAEERLRESEQRFSVLMAHLPAAVFIKDAQGRLLFANRYLREIFGWGDCVGKLTEELLPPEVAKQMVVDDRMAMAEGPRVMQEKVRDVNRVDRFFETHKFPIAVEGKSSLLGAISVDITERVKTERELANTKVLLQGAFEQTPVPMILLSAPDGMLLNVNQACLEMLGIEDEEVHIGQSLAAVNPTWQDFDEEGKRILWTELPLTLALQGITTRNKEMAVLRKNGTLRWEIVNAAPIYNEVGEMIAAFVVFPDITERKKAEEALRESEERYKNFVEKSFAGVYVVQDGLFAFLNNNATLFTGYTPEELIGTQSDSIVHPEDRGKIREKAKKMLSGEYPSPYQFRIVTRDGQIRWIMETVTSIQYSGRKAILGNSMDITDSKRAEQALQESEERNRTILQTAMDGFALTDAQGHLLEVNKAYCRMIGYSEEELLTMSISDMEVIETEAEAAAHVQKVMIWGNDRFETRHRCKDGSILDVEVSVQYKPSKGGQIVVFLRDITERKLAEEALRESEEKFRRITENMSDLVCEIDAHAKYQYVSPSYQWVLGYSPQDLIGDSVFDRVHPDDRERVIAVFMEGVRTAKDQTLEFRYQRADGNYVWLRSSGHSFSGAPGEFFGAIINSIDITESKQAEAEIRRLNEELEQRVIDRTAQLEAVNKELESFAYSISHDLRAPLRGIDGWSLALLEDCADTLDERGHKHLKFVRQETQRMGKLIDALLELSRLARTDMRREQVDLSALARSIATRLQYEEPDRQVEFIIQPHVTVSGNVRLFEVMISNLLGNAWKFTGKHHSARIEFGRTERDGQSVYFVRDDGAGFDMAHAGRLFGAFERLHQEAEFSGNGIGLATVRRIVNRHGGRVWAEGEVEKGATFYFVLQENLS